MQCDFCSSPHPTVTYRARAFGITAESEVFPDTPVHVLSGVPYVATDDVHPIRGLGAMADETWLACPTCAGFIDAKNLDGLLRHCLDRFEREEMLPPDCPRNETEAFYRTFFTAFFQQLQFREPDR